MSSKPSEETLIAYLYGELSAAENKRIRLYLKNHPEEAKSLEEMKKVRKVLGKLQDKEVIEPIFDFGNKTTQGHGLSTKIRYLMAIAASLALIILTGFATDLRIKVGDGSLTISFEKQIVQPETTAGGTTAELMKTYLESNGKLRSRLEELESNLASELATLRSQTVSSKPPGNDQLQALENLADKIKKDNQQLIYEYLAANKNEHEQVVRELLTEFSTYLEDQRQRDLQILQARMDYLKQNSEFNQYQTEQMFSSLMSTVNNQNN